MRRTRPTPTKTTSLRSQTWMSLLASTTLGVEGAKTVRAQVRADEDLTESRDYRLVVHSYDAKKGEVFVARPVASLQRAVTAAELRKGVHVSLLELRERGAADGDGAVVAWIEAGKPDLEFDGRMARPLPGSIVGRARRGPGAASVQIRLSRKAAA